MTVALFVDIPENEYLCPLLLNCVLRFPLYIYQMTPLSSLVPRTRLFFRFGGVFEFEIKNSVLVGALTGLRFYTVSVPERGPRHLRSRIISGHKSIDLYTAI
jgi:hypothetical protein